MQMGRREEPVSLVLVLNTEKMVLVDELDLDLGIIATCYWRKRVVVERIRH